VEHSAPGIVVIDGDLENTFYSRSDEPTRSTNFLIHVKKRLLRSLYEQIQAAGSRLVVIRGNHDIHLKSILPSTAEVTSRAVLSDASNRRIAVTHGHAYPSDIDWDCLILAHIHPVVRLKDNRGFSEELPVFLRAQVDAAVLSHVLGQPVDDEKLRQIIILPAFNPYLLGSVVNDPEKPHRPGMIERLLRDVDFRVSLTDGTFLGNLRSLSSENS